MSIPQDTLQAARCERVATREPHPPHLYKATSASGWLYDAQCPGVATCGASSPHDAHDAAFADPGEASHCEGWPPSATVATFDAVKWLRYMADKERVLDPKFRPCPEKYDQAADEIERLRAIAKDALDHASNYCGVCDSCAAAYEELKK